MSLEVDKFLSATGSPPYLATPLKQLKLALQPWCTRGLFSMNWQIWCQNLAQSCIWHSLSDQFDYLGGIARGRVTLKLKHITHPVVMAHFEENICPRFCRKMPQFCMNLQWRTLAMSWDQFESHHDRGVFSLSLSLYRAFAAWSSCTRPPSRWRPGPCTSSCSSSWRWTSPTRPCWAWGRHSASSSSTGGCRSGRCPDDSLLRRQRQVVHVLQVSDRETFEAKPSLANNE